ncbi:MAG: hypothetical protein ACOZBW_09420 [Thermodesulfobacteriota bacterium]
MAIRKSLQEEMVVSGAREEWLSKCVRALESSGFTKVTKNEDLCQVEAAYKKFMTRGTVLITLIPLGPETKLTIVSTANMDNIYALFKSPNKTILSAFKKGLENNSPNRVITQHEVSLVPFDKKRSETKMKFDWGNWNLGGRVIFVAGCAAVISMLMDWVDVGIASQSGLSQGAFWFLGLWAYPLLMLFKNRSINKLWGLVCATASIVLTIGYISSKSVELFDETVNAAATGAWLFLFASIALLIGILQYRPASPGDNNAEPGTGTGA